MSDELEISAVSVFGGFLSGIVICLFITLMSVIVVGGLFGQSRHDWLFPLCGAVVTIIVGAFALKKFHSSGVARGIVIAMAMGLLLNGICGVASLH